MKIKWIPLFFAICLCFATSAAVQADVSGAVLTAASSTDQSGVPGAEKSVTPGPDKMDESADKINAEDTDETPPSSAAKADEASGAEKIASYQAADAINWYNYQEGMDKGKKEEKKIFINFFANWCHYCKVMKKTTFKDKKVIAYLNENFIPVRVNADKNKKLAANYQVTGLPMSWFVGKDGEHIGGQPGYIPPDMLLPLLKYIHTDSYKKMNFQTFKEKM